METSQLNKRGLYDKTSNEISASNKENLIIKAIFFAKSPSGVILITLIEVKDGDSGGMRETGETSQRTRRGMMVHRSPRGGQEDVGHEGVATLCGALSLCTPPKTEISRIIHS